MDDHKRWFQMVGLLMLNTLSSLHPSIMASSSSRPDSGGPLQISKNICSQSQSQQQQAQQQFVRTSSSHCYEQQDDDGHGEQGRTGNETSKLRVEHISHSCKYCFASFTRMAFSPKPLHVPLLLSMVMTVALFLLLLESQSTLAWTPQHASLSRRRTPFTTTCHLPTTALSLISSSPGLSESQNLDGRRWLSLSSTLQQRPFVVGPLSLAAPRRGRPPGKNSGGGGKKKKNGVGDNKGSDNDVPMDNDELVVEEDDEDDDMTPMMMTEDDIMDPEAVAAAAAAAAASDQDVEELLLVSANLNDDDDDETAVASVFDDDDADDDVVKADNELTEDNEDDEDDDDDKLVVEVEDLDEDEEEEEEEDEYESAVTVENYDDLEDREYDVTTTFFQDMEANLEEWDAIAGDGQDYPLEDEPSDPNYQKQKELLEESTKATDQWRSDEQFDELDYIMNKMTPEEAEEMEQTPFQRQVEEKVKGMLLTTQDVLDYLGGDENNLERQVAEVSDLMDDDPYPRFDADGVPNFLEKDIGVTDDDMEALDNAWKTLRKAQQREPWDKVTFKDMNTDWGAMPNQTLEEMEACLEELGGSAYNVTRWLLYDLDFNVSNLFLAAVKHNPQAPILFQHWYPQLVTYQRYQNVRDRNFDFSWEDVEQADITELERYYAGFGYDEIPEKAPAETGIISVEELDEEELRMAAFENWMADVYNPELDRKDFDDDEIRDEDNVFSDFYDPPQHPDLPSYEDAVDDVKNWVEDTEGNYDEDDDDWSEDNPDEIKAYRNLLGRDYKYKVIRDDEFTKLFRGHLIVACSAEESDLEVAEKITLRMDEAFGKQVFVETRVMAHARPEDNVFEIWLESYEIDLLHSKKRAMSNNKNWKGPAECDDQQIDYLVERVGFLISDESRYSYRMELEAAD